MFLSAQQLHNNMMEVLEYSDRASRWYYPVTEDQENGR